MTIRRRSINELDLDAALRAMLAEGADVAPIDIAQRALREVARTRQARRPLFRASLGARSTLAWAAAAIIVALLGLLLTSGLVVIGPHPTPSPRSTPAPTGLVPFTSGAGGYEVGVPAGWVDQPSTYADVRRWLGPDGAQFMVSYGASIFRGGRVTACGPDAAGATTCSTLEFGYSVPYDRERDGVGPIDLEFARSLCPGGCFVERAETSVDGEPATLSRIQTRDQGAPGPVEARWVSLFHDHRPVILHWVQPLAEGDLARVEAIRSSFRFLDAPPDPSAVPFVDPAELLPFSDADAGFEMLVPRMWAERGIVPDTRGLHEFGAGRGFGTHGHPALTISVGAPDGTVSICQGETHACSTVVVHSVRDLATALSIRPDRADMPVPGEISGDIVLAGEPGRWERPRYPSPPPPGRLGLGKIGFGGCLGCPGVLYHAFTVKDGRPIVLSFDFWIVAFGELPEDYLEAIMESVHLTSEGASPSVRP